MASGTRTPGPGEQALPSSVRAAACAVRMTAKVAAVRSVVKVRQVRTHFMDSMNLDGLGELINAFTTAHDCKGPYPYDLGYS